jgi:hypothetical protein
MIDPSLLTSNLSFVESYRLLAMLMATETQKRIANAGAGTKRGNLAPHVSYVDRMAVLLDHDIIMLHQHRHPSGDEGLLDLAHHAMMLYLEKQRIKQAALEQATPVTTKWEVTPPVPPNGEAEKEVIATVTASALADLHEAEDKKVAEDIAATFAAAKTEHKAPVRSTPKGKRKKPVRSTPKGKRKKPVRSTPKGKSKKNKRLRAVFECSGEFTCGAALRPLQGGGNQPKESDTKFISVDLAPIANLHGAGPDVWGNSPDNCF